jgi:predicted MPP superfamily phosphohydrolase
MGACNMSNTIDRRQFIKLAGIGGVVFASGLGFEVLANPNSQHAACKDFYFVQLSDTHWGFNGPLINPNADKTLSLGIESINNLQPQPDFIVFTGDLTHTTDDPQERRRRMQTFKELVAKLRVKNIKFVAGEHDASLDKGVAYQEFFGALHYSFDHKGIHFIALDNVSDPAALLGPAQLDWLKTDLEQLQRDTPIVVLTHRPLFDLYPQWDWHTRDGQAAIELLLPYVNVAVFYGHIHQEHLQVTEHIIHYGAKSLIFPLPAPGLASKRAPLPWNENQPFAGLGYRQIETNPKNNSYSIDEIAIKTGAKV